MKHTENATQLQQQVEEYMTRLDPDAAEYEKISQLYALHVLPKCKDWAYAHEYVRNCHMIEEKRDHWEATLTKMHSASIEDENRAIREAEEESIRRKTKIPERKQDLPKAQLYQTSNAASPAITGDTDTMEEAFRKHLSILPKVPPSANTLMSLLSKSIYIYDNKVIFRMLIFLFLLFGATGRKAFRDKTKIALRKVWQTILMGMKISYI